MKILLLEDDYALNIAIKECLLNENYSVDSFYDGLEAYEALVHKYDLFILDINVPNIDGINILSHIKKLNPNAKVIMISANIDIVVLKKAYNAGCDDYVKKPFDIDELILKINKIYSNQTIKLPSNCAYNLEQRILYVYENVIVLTKNEANLFHFLVLNRDNLVTKEQVVDYVYTDSTPLDSTVRSLVRRLRQKLPDGVIQTISSRGYKLNIE